MQALALMELAPGRSPDDLAGYAEREEPLVWALYRSGAIRVMWGRSDQPGAVALLEVESIDAGRRAIAELPLIRDGLLRAELVPLTPFTGLEVLFEARHRSQQEG